MVSKKIALLISLICGMVLIFAFIQVNQTEIHSFTDLCLNIELNGTTKDNLTAVFYFNNTYTFFTDNSTLNGEFLDYFTQRVEVIRSQVPGIKTLPFDYLDVNWTTFNPVFDPPNLNSTKFETVNRTAALFLEEWYVLDAKAHIIQYEEVKEDPWYLRTLKNPAVLVSVFASLLIDSFYLKKGIHK